MYNVFDIMAFLLLNISDQCSLEETNYIVRIYVLALYNNFPKVYNTWGLSDKHLNESLKILNGLITGN